MKAGIIGMGIGRTHLKAYLDSQDIDQIYVVDKSEEVIDALKAEYGDNKITFYEEAVVMMEEGKPDMVSICTPPKYHAALVKEAAKRGIAVLCEKPMAPTIADCDQMIHDVEEAGIVFMMGFKKRFSPLYRKLKELIDAEFGLPYSVCIRYVCGGGVKKEWFWREDDGGGPIVENTAHVLDILRFLIGDFKRIFAEGDNVYAVKQGIDQIDQAVFTIRGVGGTMCAVRAGAWASGPLKKEEMFFYFQNADVHVVGPFDQANTMTIFRKGVKGTENISFTDLRDIAVEVEYFINCVKNRKMPEITGYDGKEALRASLAIKESARTGKVIELAI